VVAPFSKRRSYARIRRGNLDPLPPLPTWPRELVRPATGLIPAPRPSSLPSSLLNAVQVVHAPMGAPFVFLLASSPLRRTGWIGAPPH